MRHTAAQPIDRLARLVVTPHPLTLHGQTSVAVMMAEGESLASVLFSAGVDDGWIVELDGLQVPALMWGRTRVKHGVMIECRRAVHNNSTLRMAAFVVLAVYAPQVAASYGLTGATAALVTSGVMIAGSVVINSVLPPSMPSMMQAASNNTQPTYSLSGGRNGARLWEPVSLILGSPYCVPDLAAQPYTYFSGEDQYLKQTFNVGVNCASISALRIGQTGIEDYQGVATYYKGFSDIADTGLPVDSVDTIAGGLLDAPSGTGPWVQRTTSVGTIQIGIDLEMNLFGVNSSSGAYESKSVELQAEYCIAGTNNWVAIPLGVGVPGTTYQEKYQSGTKTEYQYTNDDGQGAYPVEVPVYSWRTVSYPSGKLVYSNATSKPLRVGVLLSVPSNQYDIRIRKITKNDTASSSQNTSTWTQLKSFQVDTGSYSGQSLVSLNIKATGQLTGSLDQFNLVATAHSMPYWNGSSWVTATSPSNGLSNPGAQILRLARGIYDTNSKLIAGLGWADSRIDIESLKAFMVWCASKGFKFDAVIQQTMSIGDLLEAIAYAGMGSISWSGGKLGVQWLADDAPVEGIINMGNIKARSFSVAYAAGDRADEIEYGFFDEAANHQWNSLRVQSPAVSVPTNTARLSNMGITSEAHAAILARHAMAQNIYMGKSITFDQDLEFLTYKRGTVLALSHDMTQWGYSGRVQGAVNSSGAVTLTLDDAIPAPASGSAYIGLRLVGESQYRIFTVAAFTGNVRAVTLTGAWPSGVPLPGANGQPMDALWIYDFKATPGQKVVVTKIEPSDNQGGAKVTVSPLPDEFWTYIKTGAYTPPPNRSLLKLPTVTSAVVGEVLKRQGNTFYTELTVQFAVDTNYSHVQVWGSVGGAPLTVLGNTIGSAFTWPGGLDETWNLELVPFDDLGRRGALRRVSYTVVGLKAKPDDVINFSVNKTTLSWSPVTNVDLAGYVIKFNYGQNTWWNTATPLHSGLVTEMPYDMVNKPSGLVTLLIKAVDTTGNESQNAAVITMNLGDAIVDNLLLEWAHHTTWPATKTNSTVVSGQLVANQTDLFYGQDEMPFYGVDTYVFYDTSTSMPMKYEFSVIPPSVGVLKLLYTFECSNYLIEYKRFNSDAFYGIDPSYFYGDSSAVFYGDDSGWQVWPGELNVDPTFGEIEFRVTTNGGAGIDKLITLSAVLDVPDINIQLDDVVISSSGTRLNLGRTVNAVKNIQITVQSDGNGGVSAIVLDKNATLGPLVRVINSSATPVTGKVDVVIQAY